ncbi:hypothetical protein UP09_31490 [Bradyrhizobium sp. LTSP885]|uniref:hypothetical protein n=1 Tax=Bradyrhizobium sp. LTSP885 TaxID=1619232 RepID=UPI0005C9A4A7|nr:hypothetical protein [Bradyrhizobium sp. LTSP885]KJC35731.1 hypothetical protein UP09_31490 [Bradyrhizobium sp. LTSP885]
MKRAARCLRYAPLAALALIVGALPAAAQELWPAVPPELGLRAPLADVWLPYRCSTGPVQNFYHGALYREPPAIYRGYAYRPYYRYTASRVVPRTYVCVDEHVSHLTAR